MKKIYLSLLFSLCLLPFAYGQHIPYGMKYQAVARDLSGQVMAEKEVSLRISLVSNITDQVAHYTEVHKATTNQFGLFTLVVGEGTPEKGAFKDIPWSTEDIWMQVDIKTGNSQDFVTISSSKLLAVPYAFHAGTASELAGASKPTAPGSANPANGPGGGNSPGVPAQAWSLFGNSNVNPLTDFLGSTNYEDLVMITNNLERLRITKDGDVNIATNLNVGNDVHIGNDLTVEKDVLLNNSGGATVNRGPFTVSDTSPSVLTGTLNVNGATDLDNTLNVDGTTDLNSSLSVNNASPTTLTGTLNVNGATDLDNTLNVDGTTDLNSSLSVNNASPTTLTGTLGVDGATDLNNTLNVDGASDLQSTLHVVGATDLDNTLNVDGAADFNTTVNIDGASTLNSTLHVVGATDLDNTLNVDGATDLNSTLSVDGATDLNSTLNADGATNLGSTLQVAGATTVNNTLAANGQVTINANLSGGDGNYGAYPLRVQGSDQGIAIKVNGSRNGSKNFVTFMDAGGTHGRIEGQTNGELASDPEYIFDNSMLAAQEGIAIAQEVMAIADVAAAAASTTACVGLGVCATAPIPSLIAASVANLVVASVALGVSTAQLIAYNAFRHANIGVTYQSGAGDYAEWLPKANLAEAFHFGDVVGVKGGLISKSTSGAERIMVISERPIVLGNMPAEGQEANYEKVAFMGQVPVKVFGKVQPGDYILASGGSNGFGIAKKPADMEASDYKRLVGIAWSGSDREGVNHVNTAVGLNGNDMANLVQAQENKIAAQAAEIAALKNQISQTNSVLAQLVPGFQDAMANNGVVITPVTAPVTAPVAQAPETQQAPLGGKRIVYNPLSSQDIEAGFALAQENLRNMNADMSKLPFLQKLYSDPAYKAEIVQKIQTRYNSLVSELTQIEDSSR